MNLDKLVKNISKRIAEKFVGEDNSKIKEALIELIIEINQKSFDYDFIPVCFPVPIEDNYHKIKEYKIDEGKIEDDLAILNLRKNEKQKIYFKIESRRYEYIKDYSSEKIFLNPQKYTSISDKIKNFLDNNFSKFLNKRDLIREISTWIFLNLKYSNIDEMKDAEWIFENRIGNCVHYTTLFISFCRHFKIPARYVLGFAKYGNFYPHTWAEFYDYDENLWIPVDVSLNQKFYVDATHIPISRLNLRQVNRYFKEVNLKILNDFDEIFRIINFGTEKENYVEIDVKGKILKSEFQYYF
ncbi:MAG: transglutaminase-like domain-containing protein [Candidatus Altarchaeaceae archaeon]